MRLRLPFFVILVAGLTIYWSLSKSQRDFESLACVRDSLAKREFSQACIDLDKHLEANPDDETAILLAAQTARRVGNYSKALQILHDFEQRNGATEAATLERKLNALQQGDLSA